MASTDPTRPTRRFRASAGWLVAALVALAAPAAAQAAYAPQLQIALDTTQHSASPALTTRITQASGETASKTIVLHFPAGFGIPPSPPDIGTCSAAQESNRTCPADSQIGTATAATGVGTLSGTINYGGVPDGSHLKLIVFLSGGGGLVQQTLEGLVSFDSTGITTTFDNLPNLTVTDFLAQFLGGSKALFSNPRTCGPVTFTGAFTSQNGEQASSSSSTTITGCTDGDTTGGDTSGDGSGDGSGGGTTGTGGGSGGNAGSIPGLKSGPLPTVSNGEPAKLKVQRVSLRHGRLDVLAAVSRRADGELVGVDFAAAGRHAVFVARVSHGRVHIRHALPAALRKARSGVVTVIYPGSKTTRSAVIRLRTGSHAAGLKRGHVSLRGGVLKISGRISRRAHGVVQLYLGWDGGHWSGKARIRHGRWQLSHKLPAAGRKGGYLTIAFAGDRRAGIRGEQDAVAVRAR